MGFKLGYFAGALGDILLEDNERVSKATDSTDITDAIMKRSHPVSVSTVVETSSSNTMSSLSTSPVTILFRCRRISVSVCSSV